MQLARMVQPTNAAGMRNVRLCNHTYNNCGANCTYLSAHTSFLKDVLCHKVSKSRSNVVLHADMFLHADIGMAKVRRSLHPACTVCRTSSRSNNLGRDWVRKLVVWGGSKGKGRGGSGEGRKKKGRNKDVTVLCVAKMWRTSP